jgi:hypothetical protein
MEGDHLEIRHLDTLQIMKVVQTQESKEFSKP